MVDDELWRVTYAFPFIISIVQVLLLIFVYKYEPIDFSIVSGNDENALKQLKMIYKPKYSSNADVFEKYIQLRRSELTAAQSSQKKVTIK